MAVDIDAVLDRRSLRKKISFWRIAALIALAVAIIAALSAGGLLGGAAVKKDHIARVEISGVITQDRPLLEMLEKIKTDKTVKGMMIVMNSPGGTTVGGEDIFNAVREVAKEKPVVTSIGTLAASAGYMIATGADHIVARRTSIVGSIGVIFQYPQAHELLDKIGVTMEEVKSAPLKAEPSPFHTPPPGAREAIKVLIDDSYAWFVDLVADRRPLTREEVLVLADGRVFSGDRSQKNKLIDGLGDENTAKAWLTDEKGLDAKLKFRDWKPKRNNSRIPFLSAAAHWWSGDQPFDFSKIDPNSLPDAFPKRLMLEGLLSIWK